MSNTLSLPALGLFKQNMLAQSGKAIASAVNNTPNQVGNPLLGSRNAPDFSVALELSAQDKSLLSMRGLDKKKQEAVEALYNQGRSDVASGTAKSFLVNLTPEALTLLQQAASLADPIHVDSLSEEGAENILLAPHEAVDLDNNGIVEVGAGRTIVFPPVNAPAALKEAWNATIRGMSEGDVLTFSGQLALPLTLPGSAYGTLSDMTQPGFNWKKFTDDMLYSNNLGRPYNNPAMSDKVESWLLRFQNELTFKGLV